MCTLHNSLWGSRADVGAHCHLPHTNKSSKSPKAAVWACCWGLRGSQQSKAGPSALFKQHRRAWAEFTLQQTHWVGEGEEQSPVVFGIYSQFPLRIHGNTQLPLQACNFTQFPSNSTCISGAFYTSRRKNHLQKWSENTAQVKTRPCRNTTASYFCSYPWGLKNSHPETTKLKTREPKLPKGVSTI